jgi:WhiB family transcriptional regulator, redox-sensing transcriptional regulator
VLHRDLLLGSLLLPELRDARPEWAADGLCQEYPDVDFFPRRGETAGPAKAVCRRCLVRAECAAFALDLPDIRGIWGSTSERDRRRARVDGIDGTDLLEMLDAPRPVTPPVPSPYQGPACGVCGGACSRRDVAVADGLCWACRPAA